MKKTPDSLHPTIQITPELKTLAEFALDQIARDSSAIPQATRGQLRQAISAILDEGNSSGNPPWDPAEALRAVRHEFGEHGGVNPSTAASTTHTAMDAATMEKIFGGELGVEEGCYLYGRHFSPNSLYFGMRLAAMEDMEVGYPTSSGMSAIMVVLRQKLSMGDTVLSSRAVYGGTYASIENLLPQEGKNVSFFNPDDLEDFQAKLESLQPKVVYLEMEANPVMTIANLPEISRLAHQHGAEVVIDNTFTPLTFTPAHHGADVVVYSTTKFINGQSDAIGGAISCSREFLMELMDLKTGQLMLSGPVMHPRDANELQMRLSHLPLRIKAHSERALEIAKRLHERGCNVYYPGLPSHPQHEIATAMMNSQYGYGGMLALDLETEEKAQIFVEKLQELGGALHAVSLGYFDTLASISGSSTSSEISDQEKERMGLSPGLVRMSIGYTGSLEAEWQKIESTFCALHL